MLVVKRCIVAVTAALFVGSYANAVDIEFDFNFEGSGFTEEQILTVESSFQDAAALWEARLTDNIVVNVSAGFNELGANVLASAGSSSQVVSYTDYRQALINDASSNNDRSAIANIPLDNISYITNTIEADLVPDGDPGAQQSNPQATNGNFNGPMTGHSHFSGCAHWDSMKAEAKDHILGVSENQSSNALSNPTLNMEVPPFEPEDTVINGIGAVLSNASFIDVNTANLKAIGLVDNIDPDAADANITFNSLFFDSFDFDRDDGIIGQDFVAIAAHEIGHALGFVSGVDFADLVTGDGPFAQLAASIVFNNNPGLTSTVGLGVGAGFFGTFINPLDLFRFSEVSFDAAGDFVGLDLTTGLFNPDVTFNLNGGGTLDLNATNVCEALAAGEFPSTVPYLSIDGGQTSIAPMSTGNFNGINSFAAGVCNPLGFSFFGQNQASHFLETGVSPENLTLGLMDPTIPNNLQLDPFATDLGALDVIGWDIAEIFQVDFTAQVNAPATIVIFFTGLAIIGLRRFK
jgi:hypothetical protein